MEKEKILPSVLMDDMMDKIREYPDDDFVKIVNQVLKTSYTSEDIDWLD